jgi:hypothetical protein
MNLNLVLRWYCVGVLHVSRSLLVDLEFSYAPFSTSHDDDDRLSIGIRPGSVCQHPLHLQK